MALQKLSFSCRVVLEEEAFQTAATQLEKLSQDMEALRKDVEKQLENLQAGFNTPAGRKFIGACRDGLLQPMNDEAAVIQHVSANLQKAKTNYTSVFTEYKTINQ